MAWRIILAVVAFVMLVIGAVYVEHVEFESDRVVSNLDPNYSIQCTDIFFDEDETQVFVKLIDNSSPARFETFHKTFFPAWEMGRFNPQMSLKVMSLTVREPYDGDSEILMPEKISEPAVLFNPKANNQVRKVIVKMWFAPFKVSRPGEIFEVDDALLKFPGFPDVTVKRVVPLSQEQTLSNSIDKVLLVFCNNHRWLALVMFFGGLIGFIGVGGFVFVVDIDRYRARRRFGKISAGQAKEGENVEIDFEMPKVWDSKLIRLQIACLKDRPGALSAFSHGLVKRFVIGQAEKTAKTRIEYLRTILVGLKLANELQDELDDLELREIELDIRRLEREIQKGDLEHRRQTQRELREAEHKRDLLKVKAESAKYQKEIRDTKEPAKKIGDVGGNSKIEELRDRIQRAKEGRAFAREILTDPDELKREENRYDNQIAELQEELDTLR